MRAIAYLCLIAGLLSTTAQANEAEVRKNMQARYPGIPVESVARTPLPGIYEVYAGGIVIYTDEKVNYLIAEGRLVDANTRTDLTAERLRKLRAIPFSSLPLNQSFTIVRGNGKRKLAYFADPNCGYCKRFEQDIIGINDITVHVFLYPVLSQDSVEKARSVWCSKDRARAWNDMMLKGVAPTAPGTCDTPVDKLLQYGREKGIGGTPTLILADGTRVPGAIDAPALVKLMDEAAK